MMNSHPYDSFFGTDEQTVLDIYDSWTRQLSEYVNSPDYDAKHYQEMYLAWCDYYIKHRDIINKHSDPL